MGSFANIFAPELIVIGGGFGVAGWDYLIPAAEEVLRREALRPMRDDVRVVRPSSAPPPASSAPRSSRSRRSTQVQ